MGKRTFTIPLRGAMAHVRIGKDDWRVPFEWLEPLTTDKDFQDALVLMCLHNEIL